MRTSKGKLPKIILPSKKDNLIQKKCKLENSQATLPYRKTQKNGSRHENWTVIPITIKPIP